MNKKSKVLATSIVSIAMCTSLAIGGTYALFTDKANVNIAVSSGVVDVEAYIDKTSVKTYSAKWKDGAYTIAENAGLTFATDVDGDSVAFDVDDNQMTISQMVAGDKVTFNLVIQNNSDVKIQYQTVIKALEDTGLFKDLEVSVDGVKLESSDVATTADTTSTTVAEVFSNWSSLYPKNQNWTVPVEIAMPIDTETELTEEYWSKLTENQYAESKSCTIAYSVRAVQGNGVQAEADVWDGTADTSWYDNNATATEFTLTTAEQFAGLAELVDGGNTFEGKTLKLASNLDLEAYDENGEIICFDPIGSYRNDQAFKGDFDGNGYTISNLNQNTWALDNGYSYSDLGMGLFGMVEDAHIKNLNVDGANLSGESAICGIIAGCAYGDSIFENITVSNSKGADYQYYSGGIVGWASGNQQYINCDVDASTSIAAQWGDFDNSTGGIIGGCGSSAQIYLKDCDVACRIDAYNDVTSSYQWYAYRRCGMLIGNTGKTEDIDGTTYAIAPQLTCENVTVTYGEWANYTYCEFAGKSWPYVRVQAGVSNSAYSNPRYGHPTDANGNEVVDDTHVHNEGEDHNILLAFDQLFGGGQGVYGTATYEGVTVIYNNK